MLMPALNASTPMPGAATQDAVQGRTSKDQDDGFGKALSSLEKRETRNADENTEEPVQASADPQEEKPSRISLSSQSALKAAALAAQGVAARAEDKTGNKTSLSLNAGDEAEAGKDVKAAGEKPLKEIQSPVKAGKPSVKSSESKEATEDTKAEAVTVSTTETKTTADQDLGSVLSLLSGQQASTLNELGKQGNAGNGSTSRTDTRNSEQKTGRVEASSAEATLSQDGASMASETLVMPEDATVDTDRTFRISSQRGKASMDMTIGASADGKMHFDVKQSGNSGAEGVTVLDARRFLGFNQSQNGAALTAAMSGDSEWAAAMHPDSALSNAATQSSTGNVVNTLKLQMTPHSLGTVTATLKLVGDQLSVHLTVENRAAHNQLSQDSSGILDALRSQGFSVDQVTVSIAPSSQSDSSQQGGDAGQRGAMPGQQGNGGQGQGNPSGGQSGPSFSSGIETNDTVTDTRLAAAGSDARSDDIYL